MANYNSIIIGAGHNGLVCAAKLGLAGQSVLLLEASETVGGLAGSREFHPHFRVSAAHAARHFSKAVAMDLDLKSHGLKADAGARRTVALSADGNHLTLGDNTLLGASDADRNAYASYRKKMQRFADALEPFWLKTIPRIAPGKLVDMLTFARMGLNIRRLGKAHMREFLRVFALPMRDLMDEHFESDMLKALLSWDGLIGSKSAPRSPNNAVLTLLYRMAGNTLNCRVGDLVGALESTANDAGVEIRTGARVDRILVEGDASGLRISGVKMQDGETIQTDRVVSSADPQTTFLNLLGVENLEIGFTNRIKRIRNKGQVAKLHLALNKLPEFNGLDRVEGRLIIAPGLDAIEFAFDHSKYGEFSERPVMEITVPSTEDPSLAPEGQHVLSAHVMFAPYNLKVGWNEVSREALAEKAIAVMEPYLPGIRESIIGSELLAPPDIERIYGASGGHWHHVEMAVDQMLMMRPTYEAAQYATPVPGLFLCGAGCHPGGDLTGAPGYNAAREILR